MKIIHRIGFSANDPARSHIEDLGIELEEGRTAFDFEESDSRWTDLKLIIKEYRLSDIARTQYTRNELNDADYLKLRPKWHCGYPQPYDDFGYVDITYGKIDYCEQCAIGLKQRAPFRIVGNPKWGKRNIMQLNWVFDEYFVTPQIYEKVFKPFGIGMWEVLRKKSESVLDEVVQLRIDTESKSSLDLENWDCTVCADCNRKKYSAEVKGFFPAFVEKPGEAHLMKSKEYFGSGHRAFKALIISKKLYQAMVEHGVSGVDFNPLATWGTRR